jgi:diguanylate cyclase (GGDEF)-like protein
MKESQQRHVWLILLISAFILIILNNVFANYKVPENHCKNLDTGWTITRNGVVAPETTLSRYYFDTANRGEVFTFTTTIPDHIVPHPALIFYAIHSEVSVKLNGEEIYSYGSGALAENRFIGYGYHFIVLPDDNIGSTVEITCTVTENHAFSSFDVPMLYQVDAFLKDYIRENALILSAIIFLILFGMILLLVSIFFTLRNIHFYKLICASMFSISIGLWSLCSHDLIMLYSDSLVVKSTIEYLSLYHVAIPVLAYFLEETWHRPKKFRALYQVTLMIQILFFTLVVVLQILNLVHLPAFVTLQHVFLVISFLGLIFMLEADVRLKRVKHKVLMGGIGIMIFMGIVDVAIFNLQKYSPMFKKAHFSSSLALGCLLFVIAQVTDFGIEIHNMMLDAAQQEALSHMAYTDVLTGLANRRKCEEVLAELEKDAAADPTLDYAIISLDLNYLKRINDTLGHLIGDQLIRSYADVLTRAFTDIGLVGRMGGDEFIVIVDQVDKFNPDTAIAKYLSILKEVDDAQPDYTISGAHGICFRHEGPLANITQICAIADERMYKMKVAMKAERVD